MAIAVRSTAGITINYGSVTIAKPSGIQVNDVLVASVVNQAGSTIPTVPAGWMTAFSASKTLLAYRIVDGSETSTFKFTTSASDDTRGAIVAFSGVDTTVPLDGVTPLSGSAAFSSTTVVAPSITTVTNNAWLVHFNINTYANAIGASGVSAAGETAIISGASSNVAMIYKVRATAGATGTSTITMGGATGNWVMGSFALRPAAGSDPVPGAPSTVTNLSESHTSTSASFTWTNPGESDFAGVMIRQALGATAPATPSDGALVTSVLAPGASGPSLTLTAATQYSFSFFAYDGNGNYSSATSVTLTTDPAAGAPNPISNLNHGESSVAISLTWTNPTDGSFAGVMVRRAAGSTPPATTSSGSLVADVAAPTTSQSDTGLLSNTTYSYSLFAHDNSTNYSVPVSVTITTLASGSAPGAGTRPTAAAASGINRLSSTGVWTPVTRQPGALQGQLSGLMPGPNVLGRTLHYRYSVTGVTSSTSRIRHKVLVTSTDIRFAYGNYEMSGGENDITVRAGLEISGSDMVAITFNGQRDVTIAPGVTVLSDPVSHRFVEGTYVYTRNRVTVAPGGTWHSSVVYSDSANGEGRDDTGADLTVSGSITQTGYIPLYGPCACSGIPDIAIRPVPCVALIGDSIMAGDVSPYVARLDNANIPYILLAHATEKVGYDFDQIRRRMRMRLVNQCTHAIVAYGINDLSTFNNAAQTEAALVGAWRDLAMRGIKVWQTTITPHTTSTDNWTTLINQSPVVSESNRIALNTWIRAGAPLDSSTLAPVAVGTGGAILAGSVAHPLAGYFEIADTVESSHDSGKWALNSGTYDGLHPGGSGYNLMQSAIDTSKFVPLP
ncbi:MAG: hypothetical protein ABIP74_00650 [Candidatus Saccharimonas sp.]